MFSRFTRHGGKHTIIIRSDRILSMGDTEDGGCLVTWDDGQMAVHVTVDGSVTDNYTRLLHEEVEAMRQAERVNQRMQPPIPRGKARP